VASAAKYDVDDETLAKEIEQLGLPRENAHAVTRPYREHRAALRTKFANDTFKLGRATNVAWSRTTSASSTDAAPSSEPTYRLRLELEGGGSSLALKSSTNAARDVEIDVPADKFAVLLHEMTQVQTIMDSLEEE